MRRATSTVKGSLRAASIAITLVTIITFATIGYSAYQAYLAVSSPAFTQGLREKTASQGGDVVITVSGRFNNSGLYPIDFSTLLGTAGNTAASKPVQIPAGETVPFNLSTSFNPFSAGGESTDALFYNGGTLPIQVGFSATLVPFAALNISTTTQVPIPPFAGNLRASSAQVLGSGLQVTLSFTNEGPATYPFSAYALLARNGGVINSTTFNGLAQSGRVTSFTLTFAGTNFAPGSYQITLHIILGGRDFSTKVTAEAS